MLKWNKNIHSILFTKGYFSSRSKVNDVPIIPEIRDDVDPIRKIKYCEQCFICKSNCEEICNCGIEQEFYTSTL